MLLEISPQALPEIHNEPSSGSGQPTGPRAGWPLVHGVPSVGRVWTALWVQGVRQGNFAAVRFAVVCPACLSGARRPLARWVPRSAAKRMKDLLAATYTVFADPRPTESGIGRWRNTLRLFPPYMV